MSKCMGFSGCPQAPCAFIKLIVQGAIFGSNHLDYIIILHAQTLADQTSEGNKNDRLFFYNPLGRYPHARDLVRPKNWNALQSQGLGPYHYLSACFPFPTRSILLIPHGQQLLLGID